MKKQRFVIDEEYRMIEHLRFRYMISDLKSTMTPEEKKQIVLDYFRPYDRNSTLEDSESWRIFDLLFRDTRWKLNDKSHASCLFYASFFVPNDAQRTALQDRTLDVLLDGTFEESFEFLFDPLVQRNMRSFSRMARFVDEVPYTHDHFSRLKDKMENLLGYQDNVTNIDPLIMFEQAQDFIFTPNYNLDLLSAFLKTSTDDTPLRLILSSFNRIREDGDVDNVAQSLYRMPASHRYALMRNLLVSDKGILGTTRSRAQFAGMFFDSIIEEPRTRNDREWHAHITQLGHHFIENADIEHLYFVIAPLLTDQILNPPQKSLPIGDVLFLYYLGSDHDPDETELHMRAYRGESVRRDLLEYFGSFRGNRTQEIQYEIISQYREEMASTLTPDELLDDLEELNDDILSHDSEDDESVKEDIAAFYRENRESKRRAQKDLKNYSKSTANDQEHSDLRSEELDALLGPPKPRATKSMSVLEFIVNAAKDLGSPGVRFLQLMGQYVKIPRSYQNQFNGVYDSIHGQSKLAAYLLLEREWPEFKQEVVEFRNAIGGGSLMTVYEALLVDGSCEVLKVLNPNADFHTEMAFKVIEELITKYAEIDPDYEIALPILQDIRDWILKDINFDDFLVQDSRFLSQNNGFTSAGLDYVIKVPKSTGRENKYYKREEYIDGVNLTQLKELSRRGHDLKSIVSLIARSYMQQIVDGQVHSDVHPGNFRITDSREVAILDRNYFLSLDQPDKMLLFTLSQPNVPNDAKTSCLVQYLGAYNPQINGEFGKGLLQTFNKAKGVDQLGDAMRYIRLQRLSVPLKMTLLAKNINALYSMATNVGFKGVEDALCYTSR